MNKTTRIVAIILCVLTLLGTLLPLAVNAQNIDSSNYVYLDFSNKADEQIVLIDNDTETTETETESNDNWDGLCEVNVVLNSEITEKTDNIEIRFTPKGSLIANDSVVLSRSNDFKGQIKLVPGEYSIAFTKADNKYEVVINENFVKVPEAKKI